MGNSNLRLGPRAARVVDLPSEFEITFLVIGALEKLQIPYMVAGSLAVTAHGVPRGTRDADLVAELRPGDGGRLAGELGGDFYLDVTAAEEAIRRHSCASTIYLPEIFKVDIFMLGSGSYDQQAFRRRISLPLGSDRPRLVFVESPEDVVLAKLKWYRLGGEVSEQQWRDVLGVLKLQAGSLDQGYLRQWAAHESVLDLLERASREAAPSGEWP